MIDPDKAAAEFEAFANAGEVEVGESNVPDQPEEKPAKKRAPAKPAEKAQPDPEPEDQVDDDEDDGVEEEIDDAEDDSDDEDGDKPKKSARDHQIERLKREKAELARQLRETERAKTQELAERLEKLEKGLQGDKSNDNQNTETPAPDPNDLDKYPLGHLDADYIEDKLEWLAETKATKQADAVLQRQQEYEQQTELLNKVDQLSTRGTEIFDDFQESVVEAGMRGDWDLSQPTFEAAHEADNGAQILYNLSQDTKEATRVARMTPFQQIKYVQEKDTEISQSKTARRKPQAGEPPKNTARGANSRTHINPATDNLDDFEKAWAADERKSR